eukprot:gene13478-15514_t
MGSSNSIAVIPTEWMEIFRAMQLKKSEVKSLYKLYKQYDFDRRGGNSKGGMDIVEWLTLIDIERTSLSERIFYAADRDGDHRLNFFEFVVSLWKFCVLGDGSLNVFAFDMFDTDSDGILSEADVHVMFNELLGEHHAHTAQNEFVLADWRKHSRDGSMTVEQFRPFSQTHQALFHEIFTIQRRMRKRTLGIRYWHFITKRKIELSRGYFVQTSEILLLHSDRRLFDALLSDHTNLKVSATKKAMLALTENAD